MMSQDIISPKSSVAEVLNRFPKAIPVFLGHHMSCVGCSMSTFETLEDAARIYGISLNVFLEELRGAVESEAQND